MAKAVVLFALVLVGGYFLTRGLSKGPAQETTVPKGTTPTSGKNAPDREWSPDEMAADPEGYLAWADRKIQSQIDQRVAMVSSIQGRREAVRARRQEVGGDLQEWEDFLKRLRAGVQRAQDEDRWPVQVGSRRFEKDKALRLLEEVPAQVEKRRPLANEYDKLLQQMDARQASLTADVENLRLLKERIALDVERVQLNRSSADLKSLGKTAEEIAHFAKILGSMGEIPDDVPSQKSGSAMVSLETLLK